MFDQQILKTNHLDCFILKISHGLLTTKGFAFLKELDAYIDARSQNGENSPLILIQEASCQDESIEFLQELQSTLFVDELSERIHALKLLQQKIPNLSFPICYLARGKTTGSYFELALACDNYVLLGEEVTSGFLFTTDNSEPNSRIYTSEKLVETQIATLWANDIDLSQFLHLIAARVIKTKTPKPAQIHRISVREQAQTLLGEAHLSHINQLLCHQPQNFPPNLLSRPIAIDLNLDPESIETCKSVITQDEKFIFFHQNPDKLHRYLALLHTYKSKAVALALGTAQKASMPDFYLGSEPLCHLSLMRICSASEWEFFDKGCDSAHAKLFFYSRAKHFPILEICPNKDEPISPELYALCASVAKTSASVFFNKASTPLGAIIKLYFIDELLSWSARFDGLQKTLSSLATKGWNIFANEEAWREFFANRRLFRDFQALNPELTLRHPALFTIDSFSELQTLAQKMAKAPLDLQHPGSSNHFALFSYILTQIPTLQKQASHPSDLSEFIAEVLGVPVKYGPPMLQPKRWGLKRVRQYLEHFWPDFSSYVSISHS